jgi:hypothetical protein
VLKVIDSGDLSGGDLLVGKLRNIRVLACMLHGNSGYVAMTIQIEECIFIQISCFSDLSRFELDVERICVLKVLNFHGLNDLSKKAL